MNLQGWLFITAMLSAVCVWGVLMYQEIKTRFVREYNRGYQAGAAAQMRVPQDLCEIDYWLAIHCLLYTMHCVGVAHYVIRIPRIHISETLTAIERLRPLGVRIDVLPLE